ncbi:MAG: acyltransferase [SAR324 cluster bacterium]|nr:acyltransferase [SAR324 cluster bacterium]
MPKILPPHILGCITMLLIVINLIFWIIPLFVMTFFKLSIPHSGWQRACSRILEKIATGWTDGNNLIMWMVLKTEWDIQGIEELNPRGSYLLISNHVNSIDIPVLQYVFNHRIPSLKFFIKQELVWIPFLGQAFWALDFPIMKRYSPAFLKRHPELHGKDLETTRRACRKLKDSPFSVINFLEGTRFTADKHHQQKSSYSNLLNPRFGSAAVVMNNMEEFLTSILDVTIVYPGHESVSLWNMLCGRVSLVVIRVRERPVPQGKLKPWVKNLWEEKDQTIGQILLDFGNEPPTASRKQVG